MASDSVLSIVREACGRIGLNEPNSATGSTDVQIRQLVRLANEEGKKLAARTRWTELNQETTPWTTFAAENQGKLIGDRIPGSPAAGQITAPASGFKYILNDTIWNRTRQVSVPGPLSPSGWQGLKATAAGSGFWSQYRIRGGSLFFYPAPPIGQLVVFEFVSENWVSNVTTDTFRRAFSMDDDYPLLDSDLITAGLVWRWKKAKGFAYAEDFRDYEELVIDAIARNATARVVNLNGCGDGNFEPMVTVSRANWPL